MIKGFLNLPWFTWAGFALIIAMIYSFVWPQKTATLTTGFRYFVIRWSHALVWILLAVNFILRGISPTLNGAANVAAAASGLVYILFITMTFVVM